MNSRQRLVLLTAILASTIAFLDGSVVNVALPAIQRSLGGGLATQQWVIDAYAITLGALMLIAGALSDTFGRKPVLRWGLIGFLVASLACAAAPSAAFLAVSRGAQGAAGALLVPSSLAIIIATFRGPAQAKAIGTWTSWTGISFVIGPLLGGFLVDALSWRFIFAINVIPIGITLALLARLEFADHASSGKHVDVIGAFLCALGLGGPVFALIEQPRLGWHNAGVWVSLAGGLVLFAAFLAYEARASQPMLPFGLFKHRNFSAGNLATLAIYATLSANTLLVALFLQQVSGFSAFASGLALLPITLLLFALSPRFGALAGRYGPRWFMASGPLVIAAGCLLLWRAGHPVHYWSEILPAVLAVGLGLSMTVAPLTAAVLGDINHEQAGIASAINNAVSRVAGLLAVAIIGAFMAARFTTSLHSQLAQQHMALPAQAVSAMTTHPMSTSLPAQIPRELQPTVKDDAVRASLHAFRSSLVVMAGLLGLGGAVSAIGIRNRQNSKEPQKA